jgi:hypothetical protein
VLTRLFCGLMEAMWPRCRSSERLDAIESAQAPAYVYGHADKRDAETAKGLTLDEALDA